MDGKPKTIGLEALLFVAGHDDTHLLRVGTKDAHDQIVADPVRAEDPERIRMGTRQENVQFVDGHAESVILPNLWKLKWSKGFNTGKTPPKMPNNFGK